MGIFADLNARLTRNIEAHGHYLNDPTADHPEKLAETVDLLMPFVRPDARDFVKSQILGLIYEHRDTRLRVGDAVENS